ncbi:DUF1499 domain-containing protein [Oscillatoria sp. FACHB-1406]|uniref:DUF1499 domain-containing protein n=1 Tax=Oscillatoria sp. FACHB-1406 TaxID=2692846 RepID=UPI00168415EA|nr:DUF1499 domain-containing protein [Oscillatoria sp. FACHB-1406]MBD2577601.1 DUF1499 domain-containing protein [Oscillatoria sp. FACHB-1406]
MSALETPSLFKLTLPRIVLFGFVAIAIAWIVFRLAFPNSPTFFAGVQPHNLGARAGQLAPCPNTPNCVNSQSPNLENAIAPLTYDGSAAEAMDRLQALVRSTPRTQILAQTEDYLYAEFSSRWLGFVDDVEFLLDEPSQKINVRSASRLGESDLGANRQRIEALRAEF